MEHLERAVFENPSSHSKKFTFSAIFVPIRSILEHPQQAPWYALIKFYLNTFTKKKIHQLLCLPCTLINKQYNATRNSKIF
jgi:hypothetical protein